MAMKILHFILGKANPDRANGVNQVIHGLAKYQSRAGHTVFVIGISKSMKIPYEKVKRENFEVECFKKFNSKNFNYIKTIAQQVDIVHLHGVWNKKNIILGRYLESINKPYVVTAHCGYALDRLKQSNYYLKLFYHYLWQKHFYENAGGIHALTREESTDIYHFCKNKNIFVVSNGVDSDVFDKYNYSIHVGRDKIKIGYLGRIAVEKNVDNLIKAISLLPKDKKNLVELILIGPINSSVSKLKLLAQQLGISDNVKFVGGKYGQDKIQALLDLDLYVHPAYSDVVGIAVMESLALGIPTIVTRTSHMSYYNDRKAFIMVEPTAFDISRGISKAIDERVKWNIYSEQAKLLYLEQFNWKVVVKELEDQYLKIIEYNS